MLIYVWDLFPEENQQHGWKEEQKSWAGRIPETPCLKHLCPSMGQTWVGRVGGSSVHMYVYMTSEELTFPVSPMVDECNNTNLKWPSPQLAFLSACAPQGKPDLALALPPAPGISLGQNPIPRLSRTPNKVLDEKQPFSS